jgi:Flp pilus assembly CpaE family ATPase
VFARIPNDYKQAISALDLGHPIAASAPSSPVRLAIQEMSQRIAVECCGQASDPKARRGLIGRLLARK